MLGSLFLNCECTAGYEALGSTLGYITALQAIKCLETLGNCAPQAMKRLETLVVASLPQAAHPKEHIALLNTLIDLTRELQVMCLTNLKAYN
jgi:hypothetical protein